MICLKIGHSVFEKLLQPEIIEYIFLLNHLTTQLFNDILYTHTENIFKFIKFPVFPLSFPKDGISLRAVGSTSRRPLRSDKFPFSSFKFLCATATKPL